MTHEQYLDTPIREVEWLLRIDSLTSETPPSPTPAPTAAAPGPPRIS